MIVKSVEVLAGPGFKFAYRVVDLLDEEAIHIRPVDRVADAHRDSLH